MTAKVLMVQGTMSSAGKSVLTTALCRIYTRRGWRVAPFKAQNMSNNAAVCPDGSEIGRAQYTQALACGVTPTAIMNPILLKPEADSRSQVVVMGKSSGTVPALEYYRRKADYWNVVTTALDELRSDYDLVVVEGAGSPVEINLRRGDLVNMSVARYAQAAVLLAGDIDRGGIFAQMLGTLWLLEPEERALVRGLIINKFRGDLTLFAEGVHMLEDRGGVPVLGVVPYLHHQIPEEDAVAIEPQNIAKVSGAEIDIAVVRLPRISNFDDFDPLAAEPGVSVRYIDHSQELGSPHAIILPGTKSTVADLSWLKRQGLAAAIIEFAAQGGAVAGICGGYQMLNRRILDPNRVESHEDAVAGLGLLLCETTFVADKATFQTQAVINGGEGWLRALTGQSVTGYEIHMGRTKALAGQGWLEITQRNGRPVSERDGVVDGEGNVWGCYLHGLFENAGLRRAWLASLGWNGMAPDMETRNGGVMEAINAVADTVETALDVRMLDAILASSVEG